MALFIFVTVSITVASPASSGFFWPGSAGNRLNRFDPFCSLPAFLLCPMLTRSCQPERGRANRVLSIVSSRERVTSVFVWCRRKMKVLTLYLPPLPYFPQCIGINSLFDMVKIEEMCSRFIEISEAATVICAWFLFRGLASDENGQDSVAERERQVLWCFGKKSWTHKPALIYLCAWIGWWNRWSMDPSFWWPSPFKSQH